MRRRLEASFDRSGSLACRGPTLALLSRALSATSGIRLQPPASRLASSPALIKRYTVAGWTPSIAAVSGTL
jgi:hypothetical protein